MQRSPSAAPPVPAAPRRDLQTTLDGLMDGLAAAAGAEAGALYLLDVDHGDLALVGGSGLPPSALGHRVASGEGLVGQVLATSRSVLSVDATLDPRALRRRQDWEGPDPVRSFLGQPLRAGTVVWGVVELTSRHADAFGPRERVRVATLADAAALLIEQARLAAQPPPAALEQMVVSEDAPLGMLTVNARQRVTSANTALARLLGQPVEALVGRAAMAVLPVLGRPRARDAMEAALRGTPGHLSLVRGADPQGHEQSLGLSFIPLGDPSRGVVGIVILVLDITERARLEAELRAQNARALEARDRLRAVVEVVSHELRTPLTSVLGYARLLHDRLDAPPASRARWGELVLDKARLMARLVDEITDLARLGSANFVLRREAVDLVAFLRETVDDLGTLSDHHRITLGVHVASCHLSIDRDRIAQVLGNLIANAVKYWPEGGEIALTLRRTNERTAAAAVEIGVADRGPGIPPELAERIFEPFFRGQEGQARQVSGTGLGLAVSKGIVEAHGGRIWMEANPGGGAVFRFSLPEGPRDAGAAVEV
ncbi:MAG TPA: ATP-binding protein [Anaerolineae bacterium]|nr:GAF domain-containing protein [Ardenticatenia bacterium]HQZ69777.1 ATP-binding protein [Anaerolineae bacterium]HRA18990.1 ATP-binding protein [Anaerolineae bacterium]